MKTKPGIQANSTPSFSFWFAAQYHHTSLGCSIFPGLCTPTRPCQSCSGKVSRTSVSYAKLLKKSYFPEILIENCIYYFETACYVEDSDLLPCLHNGAAVLDQYSFVGTNLARDIWALMLLYLGFHVLGLFCLWRRTQKLC